MELRDHEENLNNENYKHAGNFLFLPKLIAQEEPLWENTSKCITKPAISVLFVSRIQNEFIYLLLSGIRKNKYYTILLDSTPDLGQGEQLSQVIRFVDQQIPLRYIAIHSKDAANLDNVIVERLKSEEIPMANYRAQCYDNAAVMTRHICGFQERIALLVNCDSNRLNLAGELSAKQDPVAVTHFLRHLKAHTHFSLAQQFLGKS